jgi:hypothetical protein
MDKYEIKELCEMQRVICEYECYAKGILSMMRHPGSTIFLPKSEIPVLSAIFNEVISLHDKIKQLEEKNDEC